MAFGWMRKTDGLRRFREIYAEIPRKSGKSVLGACIGLYIFAADGEPGVVKVLDGALENDQLFAIVFTIDENDDWTEWSSWKKANLNIGVSVYPDFLQARLKEALQIASRQNVLKCKHLNVWANAGSAWINMVKWNACRADVSLDEFAGESCWVGVDLASKVDLTAMVLLFKSGDEFYLFGRH